MSNLFVKNVKRICLFDTRLGSAAVFWTVVSLLSFSGFSYGQDKTEIPQEDKVAITSAFATNFPQIKVMSVATTPFDGLYEVVLDNNESVFVDKSAQHLLVNAKLLEVKGPGQVVDILEQRKSEGRKELLGNLKEKDAVVFKGKGENTTPLYVFTDVDCGYCRKLHEEVPALQAAGIDVMYFAWPRSGVESVTGKKMHKVWCAKDQQSAMTAAKTGGVIPEASKSCQSPMADQLQAGRTLGVAGTPAIFLESGQQIGGYAKADELLRMIKQQ